MKIVPKVKMGSEICRYCGDEQQVCAYLEDEISETYLGMCYECLDRLQRLISKFFNEAL